MSVPLDRLYYFLHDHCDHDVIIYHFYPHGSKKPENVHSLFKTGDDRYLSIPVLFHDQEPLQFCDWGEVPKGFKISDHPHSRLKVRVSRFSTYDKLILVHSERNSIEVENFDKDGAIPVYYWSHAIIARDWFRYAEHDQLLNKKDFKKKFLIYNRAWAGSREYRLKFADLLVDNGLHHECITSFNPIDHDKHYTEHNFANTLFTPKRQDLEQSLELNVAPSWASADYSQVDYQNTEVEVVLETLFDDTRWHLTEKTLRPIATGQPFILCATPGSLEYLKSYGFETFGQCWDESYDCIQDPVQRLEAIVQLMRSLKDKDMSQAQRIAERNRQRFFSKGFMDQVVSEFKTNFSAAATEIKKYQSCAYFLRHMKINSGLAKTVSDAVFEHVKNLTSSE